MTAYLVLDDGRIFEANLGHVLAKLLVKQSSLLV